MVSLDGGHYRGFASFKQSNFGISPIRIAGGTVKVKDEVKIEFDIVPVQLDIGTEGLDTEKQTEFRRNLMPASRSEWSEFGTVNGLGKLTLLAGFWVVTSK